MVAECAERMIHDVYSFALVVDTADGQYMTGTAAVNEYNIRMLLGPRTFFAQLGAINETHLEHAIEMLRSFAIVAPLSRLSSLGPLFSSRLNWTKLEVPVKNSHKKDIAYYLVRSRISTIVASKNQMDIRLYETIKSWDYKN